MDILDDMGVSFFFFKSELLI